ncbi:MAG: NAD(+) diphosphatase [Actinobacteria bacterium]|uniref:NAD(+) diphosphatase n=1 Tax=freshwater metagenome TaxID=449393 RepID=A0A6J6EU79_9ZZZZ|nr:NAD(+) diphosphatase [Actinomycetota bacterium]
MNSDPLLTSLILARSEIRRRNRETWTDLDWEAAKSDPRTKALLVKSGKVSVSEGRLEFGQVDQMDPNLVWVDLGIDDNSIAYLAVLDESVAPDNWEDLRKAGNYLSDLEIGLLVTSTAIFNWHKKNKFCGNCGSETSVETAGWTRKCGTCQISHHPRTDAAIICLVVDDQDRALLGCRVDWAQDFYSTFAGFVEAGESAEMTLIRELREEAGVVVKHEDVKYRGSQVWPFPASLMLGYQVRTKTTDAVADGYEISQVRWFTRAELKSECESGLLKLPSKISIARALIEEWYGEELPSSWLRP